MGFNCLFKSSLTISLNLNTTKIIEEITTRAPITTATGAENFAAITPATSPQIKPKTKDKINIQNSVDEFLKKEDEFGLEKKETGRIFLKKKSSYLLMD